ncbi:zinc finger protein 771-like isoform X2 [Sitophilus oryzae]|uniref:Zinc finger protein 771-like isoform X2 n=1 Tax=Sitophilus oryzae TaxID=7048 RepID=A0A6J2YYL7_SITOR|nr:zinc finger protein 771-like isoform X2 [Sitophilus oryzae]
MSHKIPYTSDFNKLCRTCLNPLDTQQTFSIYKDILVAKHLSEITKVQFVHHPALSTDLCSKCYQQLKAAMDFKEQVQKVESQLKQIAVLLNEASKIAYVEVVEIVDGNSSVKDTNTQEASTQTEEDLQCTKDNESVLESSSVQKGDATVKIEYDSENNPSNEEGDASTETEEDLQCTKDNESVLESSSVQKGDATVKIENDIENNPFCNEEGDASTKTEEDLQCTKDNESVLESSSVQKGDAAVTIENDIENNPSNQEGYKVEAPPPRNPLACSYCEKVFTHRSNVLHHERSTHTKEKRHKCTECGAGFVRKRMLRRHINTHLNIMPFSCEICKKRYYSEHDLNRHKVIHDSERRYMCDVCSKTFKTSGNLWQHKQTHGEKAYQCEQCGYKASSWMLLRQHQTCHIEVKEFVCDICGMNFKSKIRLVNHRKLHFDHHSNKKNVQPKKRKCNVCDRFFANKYILHNHMLIHTNQKPHPCDICGKKFRFKGNIKKHKNSCHGSNELTHITVS